MNKKIVLATGNEHKLKEVRQILPEYEILSLKDIGFDCDIIEDGSSFEENALIKARAVHKSCSMSVIADDSGICVDALSGAPGIYSARFYGEGATDEKNNEKLLSLLSNEENRRAKFVSAAAVVFDDGSEAFALGEVYGVVGREYRGSGGFGYDPLFICDENNKTYAEMSEKEKNSFSHRKLAFEKLKKALDDKLLTK